MKGKSLSEGYNEYWPAVIRLPGFTFFYIDIAVLILSVGLGALAWEVLKAEKRQEALEWRMLRTPAAVIEVEELR